MRQFKVIFEVFRGEHKKERKEILVEAGNKKLAAVRAMSAINKLEGYSELYKNVAAIEEVA